MDLVKHVVVEVIFVRPDAGFLVGIDAQGDDKGSRFWSSVLVNESIDVGGVSRRIEGNQWRIHVARGMRRSGAARSQAKGRSELGDDLFSLVFLFLGFVCAE